MDVSFVLRTSLELYINNHSNPLETTFLYFNSQHLQCLSLELAFQLANNRTSASQATTKCQNIKISHPHIRSIPFKLNAWLLTWKVHLLYYQHRLTSLYILCCVPAWCGLASSSLSFLIFNKVHSLFSSHDLTS